MRTRTATQARATSRDRGLLAVIAHVGGIGRLARLLGLSQPTVSVWKRVPAHHVIAVEAKTGISRRRLRPDIYDVPDEQLEERPEEIAAQVQRMSI